MRDLAQYLRAYRRYVSSIGWSKAIMALLLWLVGMLAPLVTKAFVELPIWLALAWMIVWASLGYIFTPYGMWKAHMKNNSR
jgi:hypothetical protein